MLLWYILMTPKEKYRLRKKWRNDITTIRYGVSRLWRCHDIFIRVHEIVGKNDKIWKKDRTYWDWIFNSYVHHICIGIRRIIDKDKYKRAISLRHLLDDICKNPDVISQKEFVRKYPKSQKDEAVSDYSKYAVRNLSRLNCSAIKSDIAKINGKKECFCHIKVFADEWIAHYDRKKSKKAKSSLRMIEEALNVLDNLACKYVLLLTGEKYRRLRFRLFSGWDYPLTIPWINNEVE